jgi:amino-acid N-acetyltransferase
MSTLATAEHPAAVLPETRRIGPARRRSAVGYRPALPSEASVLHALIDQHAEEGRLLPRTLAELEVHSSRFVVAIRRGRIVGCAELAPLSGRVAEVRSLVVERQARSLGIGRALVDQLQRRARVEGFETLCAFTHDPAYFVRMGFSIVPHTWVPEKIARDCVACPSFRRCGQIAVVRPLALTRQPRPEAFVPLAALRG